MFAILHLHLKYGIDINEKLKEIKKSLKILICETN